MTASWSSRLRFWLSFHCASTRYGSSTKAEKSMNGSRQAFNASHCYFSQCMYTDAQCWPMLFLLLFSASQSLEEVNIYIRPPPQVTSSMIECIIAHRHLTLVCTKTQTSIRKCVEWQVANVGNCADICVHHAGHQRQPTVHWCKWSSSVKCMNRLLSWHAAALPNCNMNTAHWTAHCFHTLYLFVQEDTYGPVKVAESYWMMGKNW